MATPVTIVLGASQRVAFIRDDGLDEETTEGLSEECALTVTYQLAEGEDLATVTKEKAIEIGALHAEAQKAIRLGRAERKFECNASTNTRAKSVDDTTAKKPPTKFANPEPPFHPNGNGGPPITGPQRMAIEEHFRRLEHSEQDILDQISSRFGKTRLTDLTVRQASDLLNELQRMSIEPTGRNPAKEPIHATVHGRRGSKRSDH